MVRAGFERDVRGAASDVDSFGSRGCESVGFGVEIAETAVVTHREDLAITNENASHERVGFDLALASQRESRGEVQEADILVARLFQVLDCSHVEEWTNWGVGSSFVAKKRHPWLTRSILAEHSYEDFGKKRTGSCRGNALPVS